VVWLVLLSTPTDSILCGRTPLVAPQALMQLK
jgi:hypothetical protein